MIPFDLGLVSVRDELRGADVLGSLLRSVDALSYATACSWSAIFEGWCIKEKGIRVFEISYLNVVHTSRCTLV